MEGHAFFFLWQNGKLFFTLGENFIVMSLLKVVEDEKSDIKFVTRFVSKGIQTILGKKEKAFFPYRFQKLFFFTLKAIGFFGKRL